MQNIGALTPQLQDVLQFLTTMQPQDVAQYSRNCPNSLVHALVPPNSSLYFHVGWILWEKVVNYQCVFGIRASVACVEKKGFLLNDLANCLELTKNTNPNAKDIPFMQDVFNEMKAQAVVESEEPRGASKGNATAKNRMNDTAVEGGNMIEGEVDTDTEGNQHEVCIKDQAGEAKVDDGTVEGGVGEAEGNVAEAEGANSS